MRKISFDGYHDTYFSMKAVRYISVEQSLDHPEHFTVLVGLADVEPFVFNCSDEESAQELAAHIARAVVKAG